MSACVCVRTNVQNPIHMEKLFQKCKYDFIHTNFIIKLFFVANLWNFMKKIYAKHTC